MGSRRSNEDWNTVGDSSVNWNAPVFLFILSAQPAGVGFLVAAKSIFRFGELKDNETRMEAEYIIIGTMLSFAWALTIAWLTQWAITAI
jgi:hypothetical protein